MKKTILYPLLTFLNVKITKKRKISQHKMEKINKNIKSIMIQKDKLLKKGIR